MKTIIGILIGNGIILIIIGLIFRFGGFTQISNVPFVILKLSKTM